MWNVAPAPWKVYITFYFRLRLLADSIRFVDGLYFTNVKRTQQAIESNNKFGTSIQLATEEETEALLTAREAGIIVSKPLLNSRQPIVWYDADGNPVPLNRDERGLASGRPAADAVPMGSTYWSINTGDIHVSDGTQWTLIGNISEEE